MFKVSRDIINESSSQGNFPQMENIAAYKPISASPSRSTCGLPEWSSYCQSAYSHSELGKCYQAFCVQDCPYRSSTPPFAPLLLRSHRFIMCRTFRVIEDCLCGWIVCLKHLNCFTGVTVSLRILMTLVLGLKQKTPAGLVRRGFLGNPAVCFFSRIRLDAWSPLPHRNLEWWVPSPWQCG